MQRSPAIACAGERSALGPGAGEERTEGEKGMRGKRAARPIKFATKRFELGLNPGVCLSLFSSAIYFILH